MDFIPYAYADTNLDINPSKGKRKSKGKNKETINRKTIIEDETENNIMIDFKDLYNSIPAFMRLTSRHESEIKLYHLSILHSLGKLKSFQLYQYVFNTLYKDEYVLL